MTAAGAIELAPAAWSAVSSLANRIPGAALVTVAGFASNGINNMAAEEGVISPGELQFEQQIEALAERAKTGAEILVEIVEQIAGH